MKINFGKIFTTVYKLLFLFLLLTVNNKYAQTFKMVDNFETHNWHWFQWGDDNGSISYSNFWSSEGNSSLKLSSTKNTTGWNIFGTGCFDTETPDSIKLDIYAIDNQRLEVKVVNSNNQEILLDGKNLSAATQYLDWKINLNGNQMRKLYLVQVMYNGTVTVYVDNIRSYKNGIETVWDSFEQPQYYWDGSAEADNKDYEVVVSDDITHTFKSQNFNSTASQIIQWNASNDSDADVAQIQSKYSQPKDWSDYYYFRMDVYRPSSTPNCSLFVFIWNGTNGTGTDWVSVPADQWTTVTMKLGHNIDMSNIEEIKIVVPNTDSYSSGKFYIDNLQVGGFTPLLSSIETPSIGVKYSLDDFDGRVPDPIQKDSVARAGYNDYFGYTGPAKSDSAQLNLTLSNIENNEPAHTKPFARKINYDVGFDVHTWISNWNLLGPGSSPPPRDMSGMEKFSLWIKGDAVDGYSNRITIEFHDDQWGNPGYNSGKAFAVLSGITSNWQQWIIPFDPDSLVIWGTFDPTKVTEVVISLDNSTTTKTNGTFYVDDLQFIDTDEVYWDEADFDEDFLDLVERRTFNYFIECVNDTTGLIQDRASLLDLATVAGTGFGLAAIVSGTERGWISQQDAESYVEKVLSALWNSPQSADATGTNGYKGFFYHFLESGSGLRKQVPTGRAPVELSVVDTGILMAGVLLVKEYFSNNLTIVNLAEKLYKRVDWAWFYDTSVNQFHLGWSPEGGFVGHWDISTDEVMLINILAVGSPTHPVPSNCFYSWQRDVGTYNDHTIINSWNGSLFQYFFNHCWFDLHGKEDAQHVNWFHNSVEAGNANRDYCIAGIDGSGRSNVPTYGANSWGLTATEHVPAGIDTFYFGENGALPTWQSDFDSNFNGVYFGENNGTVPPYGAGSMIGFAAYSDGFNSSYVYEALKNYYLNTQLWTGNYGFRDCYTDTAAVKHNAWSKFPMYKNNFFSIDLGPMLMMIENYRSKLIWQTLGENEYIQKSFDNIFIPEARVNDDFTVKNQLSPATSANAEGKYVVVWSDGRDSSQNYIYVQEFHAVNDVGLFRVDGVNKKVASINSIFVKPKVAINGNAKYLIDWVENNNVYISFFSLGDTSASSISTINTNPVSSNEYLSAITSSEFGQFAVVWTGEDDGKDIFVQLVDSSGNKIGNNIKVNNNASDSDQRAPDIAMADDGHFVIVWEDERNGKNEIYAQLFNSNGTLSGANFKISGNHNNSIKPSVDMNGSGNFVVSWLDTSSSQRNIYAVKFDSNCVQLDSIINVSSNSNSPAVCQPDIAIDSYGTFVVVWQDNREGSMDVYYQVYYSDGSANGSNSRVHSERSESNQVKPSITSVGTNGSFQVIWQDDRSSDWDIFCPVINYENSNVVKVENKKSELPVAYGLMQNYPNPFNPTTTINYSLPKSQNVKIEIYDMLGRKVKTLVDGYTEAGYHSVYFNASGLSSGIYIYRIIAGNFIQTKKMLLLK